MAEKKMGDVEKKLDTFVDNSFESIHGKIPDNISSEEQQLFKDKQHITKITIESIPKFIHLGIQKRAQNDAKTEPGDDRAMALIFLGAKVVPRVASRAHLDLMLGLFWATWASFLRTKNKIVACILLKCLRKHMCLAFQSRS